MALSAKKLVIQATPSPSDLLPDLSVEVEVVDRWWRRAGPQIRQVRLPRLNPSENIALCQETCSFMLPFVLYWEKKCKGCKNSPENRLSGFLKELSWGSKQHGGSEDEVVTDGISGAWHNSPI